MTETEQAAAQTLPPAVIEKSEGQIVVATPTPTSTLPLAVSEKSEGQIVVATSTGTGQPSVPTNGTVTSPIPSAFTGAGATVRGDGQLGWVVGAMAAFALL